MPFSLASWPSPKASAFAALLAFVAACQVVLAAPQTGRERSQAPGQRLLAAASAAAPTSPASAASQPSVNNSNLNSQTFLDIFTGELAAYYGDARVAWEFLMRAAHASKDEGLYQRAIELAETLQDPIAVREVAQAWLKDVPDSPLALRTNLVALLWSGKTEESERLLRARLATLPATEQNSLVQHWLGYMGRSPQLAEAMPLAEHVGQDYPSAPAMLQLALLRLSLGDVAQGLNWLNRAQQLDVQLPDVAQVALRNYSTDPTQMGEIVTHYLRAKPTDGDIRMGYAQSLLAQGDTDAALKQSQEVLKQQPQRLDALLLQGVLLEQANRLDEAAPKLRQFLQLAQQGNAQNLRNSIVTAHLSLAELLRKQGKRKESEAEWQQIRDDEALIAVAVRRAVRLYEQKQPQAARQLLDQLPENDDAARQAKFDARTTYLRQTKQHAELYALYLTALQQHPDDQELKYEAAIAADSVKNYEQMERWLRELIDINPKNRNALNALGYSLADRNLNLPQARNYIEQALKLSPNDPMVIDSLGWVLYRQGQLKEAKLALQRAYAARRDADIAAHLGEVLWSLGEKDRAQSLWREANRRTPGSETLLETMRRFGVKAAPH